MGIIDFEQAGTLGGTQKPKRYDIEVYQDDSYEFQLKFATAGVPTNITGWTGICQIRPSSGADSLIGTAVVSIVAPATNGVFLINFDAVTSIAAGTYKYDIQILMPTKKRTIIGGKFTVTEDVSE